MGLFAAARSVRNTFWVGLALFGYYFLASDLFRRALGADPTFVWFVFLALLFVYGFWTRSPIVALLTAGTIVFLWVVAGLAQSGLSPDIDPRRPGWTLYHAIAPIAAVGLGSAARALLFRKRDASPSKEES